MIFTLVEFDTDYRGSEQLPLVLQLLCYSVTVLCITARIESLLQYKEPWAQRYIDLPVYIVLQTCTYI